MRATVAAPADQRDRGSQARARFPFTSGSTIWSCCGGPVYLETIPDVPEIRLDGIEELRASGEKLFEARGFRLPVSESAPARHTDRPSAGCRSGSPKRRRGSPLKSEVPSRCSARLPRKLCATRWRARRHGCNFAGTTTLREFIDMTAACRVFLTNDSGAMHIASALGVPSVTVFGPTDETATGPLGPAARLVREPVDCAPCLLRECPIDHRCMTRVTADRVVQAAQEVLMPKTNEKKDW